MTGEDPRPDLTEDSHLWELVLQAALRHPLPRGELYWPLEGMRRCGARLRIGNKGTFKFEPPPPGSETPEYTEKEFKEHCDTYLKPHLSHLRIVLNDAMERYYKKRKAV